jgi:D-glycero-alpha-D-manno-heptose-7-phosphate kinase
MIITRTPYRVSLFGGGTDFPAWFCENQGKVISLAIDKYCYISTRILPPFFNHRFRIAYSKVEVTDSYESIEHPAVREAIKLFAPEFSLEIHYDGDLPARSGVGSSSAFVVGLINSLSALKGLNASHSELANLAIRLEQEILKENVGWQDQIACAYGGLNSIEFGPWQNWKISQIKLDFEYLQEITSRMVLVYSGIERISSDISAGMLTNLNKKQKSLKQIMNLADECEKIFLAKGNLDQIGEMLDFSWRLKKEINPHSTSENLNEWYDNAIKAGAIGGKILGAGGGGFFLFWVDKEGREDFLNQIGEVISVPVKICSEGSKVIYNSRSIQEVG